LTSIATQLSGLLRQFKIERSDRRFNVSVPVTLSAIDIDGQALEQEAMTVNISRNGALLKGLRSKLRMGSSISLARLNKVERFLVQWEGEENTPRAGQLGVCAVDSSTSFWRDVIEKHTGAEQTSAVISHSKKVPMNSKPTFHGA